MRTLAAICVLAISGRGLSAFAAANSSAQGENANAGAGRVFIISQSQAGGGFAFTQSLLVSPLDSRFQIPVLHLGVNQPSAGSAEFSPQAAVAFPSQVVETPPPATFPGFVQERVFAAPGPVFAQPDEEDPRTPKALRETLSNVGESVQGVEYARETGSLGDVAQSGVALEEALTAEEQVVRVARDPDVVLAVPAGQPFSQLLRAQTPAQDRDPAAGDFLLPGVGATAENMFREHLEQFGRDTVRLLGYFLNLPLGETPRPPAVEHPMAQALVPIFTETAQRRNEEHNQSLSQRGAQEQMLLNIMMHELRNPLAPLRNVMYLLDGILGKAGLKSQTQDVMDIMSRQIFQMSKLIDTSLKLARLESGKYKPELKPVDIVRMIQEAVQIHVRPGQDVRLVIDQRLASTNVQADPDTLEMVVSNLLSNAVKYGDGNPIIVRISPDESGHVLISFSDKGRGIPQDELEKISERFFRASTSAGIAGTGIGLNTTAKILEAHGSRLVVESRGPGLGSTISFLLAAAP